MSKLLNSIEKFIKFEATAGILLLISALAAIVFANSSASHLYYEFVHLPIDFGIGIISTHTSLGHFVNDGLMAVFFLVVSLEIKQELMVGHLSSPEQRNLPLIAAIAGVVFPALMFFFFNSGVIIDGQPAINGWAIPTATDIAFALGVLALFGKRVPVALKVFLMALAIIDDLIAILIIALFYNNELSVIALLSSLAVVIILGMLNVSGVKKKTPYLCFGFVLWAFVLKSGIHATLAGVVLGLFIPLSVKNEPEKSPLKELVKELHYLVGFFIVPLFAFVNSGISLKGVSLASLFNDPIAFGIMLGLFLGKQIGIFGIIAVLVKSGISKMPKDSTWGQIYGVTLLTGIGFTMSIFVGTLAYPTSEAMITSAKMGIIFGSLLSAVIGYVVLHLKCPEAIVESSESESDAAIDINDKIETIQQAEEASEQEINELTTEELKLMTPEQRKAYKSALKAEKLAAKLKEKAEIKARKEMFKKEKLAAKKEQKKLEKAEKALMKKNKAKSVKQEKALLKKEKQLALKQEKKRTKLIIKTEIAKQKIRAKASKEEKKASARLEQAKILAKQAEDLKFNSSVKMDGQNRTSSRLNKSENLKEKLTMIQSFTDTKKIAKLEKKANNEMEKAEKILTAAKKMETARTSLLTKRIANFEEKIKNSNKSKSILSKIQNSTAATEEELISDKLSSLKEMFNTRQGQIKSSNINADEEKVKSNSNITKKRRAKKENLS